jgi:predicted RNA binding protein with dsRBD fold (UPF0201 family)
MIITVSIPVHPTESEYNVKKAVKNLFPLIQFTVTEKEITGTSEDKKALIHLKELLEKQKIRSTAHDILNQSVVNGTLVFYLNKQAALMGKVNFSRDCPLGPITVSITGADLTTLIDELSPRT